MPPADPAPEPIGGEAPAHASAQTAPAADPTAAPDLEPSPLLGPPRQAPTFRIEALPAGHGDCLWIEYGDEPPLHRILIDCGTQGSAKTLVARVGALPANERVFDLFVMTHIDADHIGGALALLREVKHGLRLGDVWFNGWRHVSGELGARQAEMFSTAIQDLGLPWNQWRDGDAITTGGDEELPEHRLPDGMKLTLLSPTPASLAKLGPVWKRELKRHGLEPGGRVDYGQFLKGTPSTIADAAALLDIDALADSTFTSENGAPNGSSIAVLAEYRGKSVLLAADAHAPVLIGSIKALLAQRGLSRLELDLLKVSHHGSQNNLNRELLELIECPRYLISTNGDHFYHPDRQAIARIFKYGGERKELFFNYNNRLTEVWGSSALARVRERYRCETRYPAPDRPGIAIAVL